ncbi:sulfotransferase [Streptomyces sp. Z26]|uniref:sulfotransferase family protein n=1 Tax=Streptomyces sp. Z26 TaxID=2500177 RepID=UPI000EF13366|nr:sulfotransferase [Streptomyces sp. Z26]RLL68647.1 sulfotransferase [Streptomyces sp. Z26]
MTAAGTGMLYDAPAPRRADLTPRGVALAYPKLPLAMRALAGAAGPFQDRLWRFDPDELKAKAREKTGLTDFGGDGPLDEPLEVLCRSARTELRLSTNGKFVLHNQILGSLVNRLRFQRLTETHPEIFAEPVRRPLFVCGMPRTGTTFVQKLLWQDSGFRSLPLWESAKPLPKGDPAAPQPDPDPRIKETRTEVRLTDKILPEQATMHGLAYDEPEEENPLLAISHCSSMYENTVLAPAYREWYAAADHTAGYRDFARVLQYLQWSRPDGDRWSLKAPGHLEMLGPLLAAFDDATVVRTHRDPVTSVTSFANMVTYGARIYFDHPDPLLVGRCATDFIERLLRAAVASGREDDRVVDVRFRDLVSDPIGEMKRIYEAADRDLDPDTERAMRDYATSEGKRGGRNQYAAEDFALDVDALRERFAFYYEHFDVPMDKR